jgi:hypothetical protein
LLCFKDNQATTIHKEVAGTARTALGSTNSGNTDQLGNKITKGVGVNWDFVVFISMND